jgi:F0F1-type ATP synthase assembly protein I
MLDPVPNPKSSGGKSSGALGGLVRAERLMQIAFILPTAVVVGWLFGYLLDKWLHQHWIYIVGILLGSVAGFVEVFHIVQKNEKESD